MALSAAQAQTPALRPPAYPLLTHTPYFSVWAFQDTLAAGPTRHWTGTPQSLEGVVRVDGRAYQFMGQAVPAVSGYYPDGGRAAVHGALHVHWPRRRAGKSRLLPGRRAGKPARPPSPTSPTSPARSGPPITYGRAGPLCCRPRRPRGRLRCCCCTMTTRKCTSTACSCLSRRATTISTTGLRCPRRPARRCARARTCWPCTA
ncbi:MAG: DUF4964 domain-containing protein [Hymenobacter sp.]